MDLGVSVFPNLDQVSFAIQTSALLNYWDVLCSFQEYQDVPQLIEDSIKG